MFYGGDDVEVIEYVEREIDMVVAAVKTVGLMCRGVDVGAVAVGMVLLQAICLLLRCYPKSRCL